MGKVCTDFLFATQNALSGAASIFSLSGFRHRYNSSATPQESDYKAIQSDWEMTGEDLYSSILNVSINDIIDDNERTQS